MGKSKNDKTSKAPADNFVTRHLDEAAAQSRQTNEKPVRYARAGLVHINDFANRVVNESMPPVLDAPARVAGIFKIASLDPDAVEEDLTRSDWMLLENIFATASITTDPTSATARQWQDELLPAFLAAPDRPAWSIRAKFHNERAAALRSRANIRRLLIDALSAGPTRTSFGFETVHIAEGGFLTEEEAQGRCRKALPPIKVVADEAGAQSRSAAQPPQPRKKAVEMHCAAILEWFAEHPAEDPMRAAPPKGNKRWPLREQIKVDLKLSDVQAKKAFTQLRKEGRMRKA
ncbi:MAG: hypothetical protein KGL43_24825 [Burkholderiales bacterium]|nr:hypothetical protein [Burkholderiales bacterium]MDE2395458.1 hypothetical protein [Burkholderiales bacterium]MDE2456826.1 hypothetical protein [Burkholderiales bacterium]